MVLKAFHVSDVPNHHDHVHEHSTLSISPSCFTRGQIFALDGSPCFGFGFPSDFLTCMGFFKFLGSIDVVVGEEDQRLPSKIPNKFMIIGHRGSGMNMLQSSNPRMKEIKENTITSFNEAAKFDIDFIEFDVQVTKDGCPIIFHDIFVQTEHQGEIIEKRVTDLTLEEFRSYGPPEESMKVGKPLFRKTNDGQMLKWKVGLDDHLCTLEEVFQKVNHSLGFNIELKFDDKIDYNEDVLAHLLELVLQVVNRYAKDRPIIFSSFHPDAAVLMRKLQTSYPVFFITKGGTEIFPDIRRNSLEEAIKLCLAANLQGIVSEVKAIIRNPDIVPRIKQSKLLLLTFGQLNNVPEMVYMQKFLGIDGVIVDFIKEITHAVSELNGTLPREREEELFPILEKISEIDGVLK